MFALCAFLALYTWNARTGYLDSLAEHTGLEVTGYLLLPGILAKAEATRFWDNYIALIGMAEENDQLREKNNRMERDLAAVREDLAELARLRELVGITPPTAWNTLGTRVLAGRFGPGAALETIMIDRGFASGAAVGTPLITHLGLVGRVFRAAPHVATVLLVTDPSFRVPVITAEGRVPGVLIGGGPRANLEVWYIAPNASVSEGEILLTSGLDNGFPKGLPVGKIVSVEPGTQTLFQRVQAQPFASPESLEEALLLIPPANWPLKASGHDTLPTGLNAAPPSGNAVTAPVPPPAAPTPPRRSPTRTAPTRTAPARPAQ